MLNARGRGGDPGVIHVELLKLRPWLGLDEAAAYLMKGLQLPVRAVEVLRLGIDGHLPLCLYLPVHTKATEYHVTAAGTQNHAGTTIDGLWDLAMDIVARKQLEHDYQFAANRNFTDIGEIEGATVESGSYRFRLEPQKSRSGLLPRPRSAFPEGGVLALRTTALEAFIATNRKSAAASAPVDEKPTRENSLGERERTTLLTVVAALCQHAKIDIAKPSAAGVAIQAMTEALGARVSARTIEEHLKKIPDAIERRAKTSS